MLAQYTIVATFCFIMYEYIINFDYEVRFLWLRRFTFSSCLLFLCRYLSVAQICVSIYEYVLTGDFTHAHCKSLVKLSASLVYLQYCLSNVVLYARTYAVWAGNKRVLVALVGSYVLSAIGTCYTVYRPTPVVGLHSPRNRPEHLLRSHWLDNLFALCLLLYKSVLHTREMKNIGFQQVSLLTVMAQDGMAYFLFNIVCAAANSIILERTTSDYRDFLVTTQCCVQNVLCARLFFHMQTARRHGMGLTTMSRMPSDIHFAAADLELKVRRHRRGVTENLNTVPEEATWTAGFTVSYLDDEEDF
ncbi:hypothetical protein SCHPADRAFT_995115 [Schizopora paradoxa]|uniref:DUF6533 domain-containing protein n=1 Tax=Schizopora paradoxa TaxID=27342 RepID=A0A0H2SH91_9AGAM|nr:hypothetical protein SCHPADRAFT_995115 [Schizopora paradoxa]